MRQKYNFECYVPQALSIAEKLSEGYGFIPREFFLISMLLLPETPGNTYIRYNCQCSQSDIYDCAIGLLKLINIPAEHTLGWIDIGDKTFTLDHSIIDLLTTANEISRKSYNKQSIAISDLLAAWSELYPDEFEGYLSFFIPNFENRRTTQKISQIVIPEKLSSFLSVLNDKYSPEEKTCRICGRDEETQKLMRILLKTTKRNAILVGEPGVGKTALVEKFAWMIVTGNCPKKFKSSVVLSLDVNAIIAGTEYRGSAEQKFMDLISFLKNNPECILFIDEVHLILGAGACKDSSLDLANSLKPILARGDTRVIGATTINEYNQYFSKDGALKRRFEKLIVEEPLSNEVYPMIRNQIKFLEKDHGVSISRKMVEFVALQAACFNYETHNPDRTLDLIDKALVSAEMNGKTKVSKNDVLSVFSFNFKKFSKMSSSQKRSIAYHESGHYLINRFSTELTNSHILAVSIMPAEDYLGVNVLEYDPDITVSQTYHYFIHLIGSFLAGRIAEKMYKNEMSAGARNDLARATKLAKDVITQYGLYENFTYNRVFTLDEKDSMLSEKIADEINEHVNTILSHAYNYAENLLKEKKAYLEILVEALMKNGILSEKDINELFIDYEKTKLQTKNS